MSLALKIKKTIEFAVNLPLRFEISGKGDGGRIWLLLTPQYLNYGDHLIALAELDYIGKKKTVIDVNYSYFEFWGDTLTQRVKKEDIIWITGGGYIGDLWPDSHAAAERIIRMFPDNKIIFAPQTVYYKDIESQGAKNFSKLLHNHGNIVFFAREQNTVNALRALHIHSILAPDFGLLSNCMPRHIFSPKYISFCLRDDHEGQYVVGLHGHGVKAEADRVVIAVAADDCNVVAVNVIDD